MAEETEIARVLLVDDHSSIRQALALVVEQEPDFTVVAQAGSLAEARGLLNGVDIAVVDLSLPDGEGLDLARDLRRANPQGMVLVLTASLDRTDYARAVEAGAAGVLHKSASLQEIVDAVRRLKSGQSLLAIHEVIELLRLASEQRRQDRDIELSIQRLTPREREVLQALADGLNDKEIAQRLTVSVETIRTHMVNLLSKLGARSRLQALVLAVRYGLVELRPEK